MPRPPAGAGSRRRVLLAAVRSNASNAGVHDHCPSRVTGLPEQRCKVFVDSHCHLDFPELADDIDALLEAMRTASVTHALSIGVTLEAFPAVLALAERHANVYASTGVHPDSEDVREPTVDELVRLAAHPKVVAIGETGLDYYRLRGDLEWQRQRFRTHIRAARTCGKPLVVHTRAAAEDTLRLMVQENAREVGGVMHCFTEDWPVAAAAMDLGFLISFSGIVTFRNATGLKSVAKRVPLDAMLIETDAPYLAPVPHRGKRNQPAWVRHVAEEIGRLRSLDSAEVGRATSSNFARLFGIHLDAVGPTVAGVDASSEASADRHRRP